MKVRDKSETYDAFRLNERGLVEEDWFWDAVSDNRIITHNFGKYHNEPAWCEIVAPAGGNMCAQAGDYILRNKKGEIIKCCQEAFERIYEIVRTAGPVEVFRSQEELNECLKWWQHRLYLDGWMIRAKVVDEIMNCNGEDMKDVIGLNTYKYEVSQSYIQILSEASFEQKNPYCEHICMEKTLVHELLHCLYGWLDGKESYEGVYLMAKEHQQIEQMAKSLVMAKYNLDYDYFERNRYAYSCCDG